MMSLSDASDVGCHNHYLAASSSPHRQWWHLKHIVQHWRHTASCGLIFTLPGVQCGLDVLRLDDHAATRGIPLCIRGRPQLAGDGRDKVAKACRKRLLLLDGQAGLQPLQRKGTAVEIRTTRLYCWSSWLQCTLGHFLQEGESQDKHLHRRRLHAAAHLRLDGLGDSGQGVATAHQRLLIALRSLQRRSDLCFQRQGRNLCFGAAGTGT